MVVRSLGFGIRTPGFVPGVASPWERHLGASHFLCPSLHFLICKVGLHTVSLVKWPGGPTELWLRGLRSSRRRWPLSTSPTRRFSRATVATLDRSQMPHAHGHHEGSIWTCLLLAWKRPPSDLCKAGSPAVWVPLPVAACDQLL